MITLLWALATVLASPVLFFAKRKAPATPRKILVIRLGKIGDLVCATPVIRALKEQCPSADIHVLCATGSAIVLKNNPFVHAIHTYDASTNRQALLRTLHREHFDWVINVMPDAFASVIGMWAGAPVRINTISSVKGILVRLLSMFSTHTLRYEIHDNTFAHQMKILDVLGLKHIPYQLDITWTPDDARTVKDWMEAQHLTAKRFVVLNPTAGNGIKEWPTEKWAQLADRILTTASLDVVLSTLDQTTVTAIRGMTKQPDRIRNAAGLSLQCVAALCAESAAFVSVDTGPLYVAYAAGAPIVAMVGPVDPAEQLPPESNRVAHVPPPPGTTPWVFIVDTPRTGTPEQLRAARDTTVDGVWTGLTKVLHQ